MPPKKRSKVTGGRAAIPVLAEAAPVVVAEGAPAAAAAAAAPVVSPLTAGGIESLRLLAKHRPQRVALGGMTLGRGAAAAPAAMAPPPQPVTLQIVDVQRYFVDHRFWTLVGVPYPTLPPQSSNAPLPSAVVAPAAAAAVSAAMSDRDGDVIMNGGGPVVAGFAAAPPAAASASSVPAPASSPLASAFDAYSDLHTAYDLVLSDGTLQLKVLLSPTLSIHVEKGGVLPRGLVRISEAVWRFDETVVDDRGFLVVRAMEVLETQADAGLILTAAAGAEPQPLQYPAWASPSMRIDRPLIGGPRSYYLSLFNDDTVTFSAESYPAVSEAERITQEQKAIHQGVAEAVKEERKDGGGGGAAAAAGSSGSALIRRGRQAQIAAATAAASGRLPMLMQDSVLLEPEVLQTGDVTTIRKLITEGVGWQAGDLSLIVRVFAKSRIQTFGRKTVGGAGGAGDLLRAPFNFELLVGDASGEQIKVVLWNTLVGTYFSRLHVGQILALRGFRLKKARSDGHYELALNPYNPIGSVRVFDQRLSGLSKDLADAVPPMVMTISRVSEVAAMAEENIFDVAGVVTFAGPMLREFSSAKQSFFQYRWLLLADDSCLDALPIKLYTNSQQENLEGVRVSDVVYISNLSVRSTLGSASPIAAAAAGGDAAVAPARSLVATSTNYSQLLSPDLMRQSGHPYLHRMLDWAAQADHGLLRAYPSYFRWSLDFAQYKQMFGETLTPLREMRPLMDRLRFQQTRSVLFQAYIAQIIIHPAGLRAVQDGVMDEENYAMAVARLKAIDDELAARPAAAQEEKKPEAAAAAAGSTKGKKARGAKSVSMAVDSKAVSASQQAAAAAAAELPASQVSTRSTRLRSSQTATTDQGAAAAGAAAGTHRRGRSRGGVPEAASARAASDSRGRTSRSASRAGGKELVRVRSMTPRKRKGKVVKTILRKRKQPAPAAAEQSAAAAAGGAGAGAVGAPAASASAPAASAAVPAAAAAAAAAPDSLVPSAPSTLATILFRDLNGEWDLAVELNDPVLGHVNFEQGVGTVAAACQTPREAPRVSDAHSTQLRQRTRIFHGLSHILPSSAFPPAAWDALIQAGAGVQPEEETDAAGAAAAAAAAEVGAGTGAAGKRGSKKKKGGAAAAAASPRAPRSPAEIQRAAIVQLHNALLSTLSPLRLLSSVTFTRRSYTVVHANLTSVFSAQQ